MKLHNHQTNDAPRFMFKVVALAQDENTLHRQDEKSCLSSKRYEFPYTRRTIDINIFA